MLLRAACLIVALSGAICTSPIAFANERITFAYDARGRLIKVVRTGTVNNNNQTCYVYDKAGNRINVKATVNGTCPI